MPGTRLKRELKAHRAWEDWRAAQDSYNLMAGIQGRLTKDERKFKSELERRADRLHERWQRLKEKI